MKNRHLPSIALRMKKDHPRLILSIAFVFTWTTETMISGLLKNIHSFDGQGKSNITYYITSILSEHNNTLNKYKIKQKLLSCNEQRTW